MEFKASALEYGDDFPKLLAAGRGYFAEKIVELAELNNITVYKDPDLAEVLDTLETGAYIPEELFRAVAKVLAYCYEANEEFKKKMDARGIK